MAAYLRSTGVTIWQPLASLDLGLAAQSKGILGALGPVRPYSSRYTRRNPITDKLKIRFLGG
jgi:hypothetical protein